MIGKLHKDQRSEARNQKSNDLRAGVRGDFGGRVLDCEDSGGWRSQEVWRSFGVLARKHGQGGEFADQLDGFKADGDDLVDEADDVFGIVFAVGVGLRFSWDMRASQLESIVQRGGFVGADSRDCH